MMSTSKQTLSYWWSYVLVGLGLITTAVVIFVTPAESLMGLTLLFSIIILIKGVLTLIDALVNREETESWGYKIVGGVLDLFIGAFLFLNPESTPVIMTFIISFWVMYRGGMIISMAFKMKSIKDRSWGWHLLMGILTLITAFVLFWNPQLTGLTVVYLLAFAFFVFGVQHVTQGTGMKKKLNNMK